MLASITPLGERGRNSRWGVTVGAFLIGSTLAGIGAGALAGAIGSLFVTSLSLQGRLGLLAAAALIALLLDASPGRIPGPRRQVNERWLDEFRGWVYGIGFGAQLGTGVLTIVRSAAIYLALVAAIVIGSPVDGALILGCFGMLRGAEPLLAAGVSRPDQLLLLHRRLERWSGSARALTLAGLGATLVATIVGAAS